MTPTSICPPASLLFIQSTKQRCLKSSSPEDIVLRQIMCRLWIWKISKTNKAIWGRVTGQLNQKRNTFTERGKTTIKNTKSLLKTLEHYKYKQFFLIPKKRENQPLKIQKLVIMQRGDILYDINLIITKSNSWKDNGQGAEKVECLTAIHNLFSRNLALPIKIIAFLNCVGWCWCWQTENGVNIQSEARWRGR